MSPNKKQESDQNSKSSTWNPQSPRGGSCSSSSATFLPTLQVTVERDMNSNWRAQSLADQNTRAGFNGPSDTLLNYPIIKRKERMS